MRMYLGIGIGIVLSACGLFFEQPWLNLAGLLLIALCAAVWGPRKPSTPPSLAFDAAPAIEPPPHALERLLPTVLPHWSDSLQQSRRLLADNIAACSPASPTSASACKPASTRARTC